jgi:type IV secretion system protein VirB10
MSDEENGTLPDNGETGNNPFDSEDTSLDSSPVDLTDEMEGAEDELPPPEDENEAREMNPGMIFAIIFVGVAIILMIVLLVGGKRKDKQALKELDKAGSKYELDFEKKIPESVEEDFGKDHFDKKDDKPKPVANEKNVDDILETLPDNLKPQPAPQPAPVAPVGSRGSSKSDRPDTRNSKSPRNIEGLMGQPSTDTNQNIVSAMMNGNYTPASQNQKMTKEEYIAQMMKQTQSLQNQMYGGGGYGSSGNGGNMAMAFQQNREQFYSNGAGTGGHGQFMSYNSLWDGTIISGALVTAINTDNPGVVIARVTENVYSSYDHSFLLIPEGSLLYATYNSSVSYGQDKIQVAWNLLIRPDGYRITLGNMNGVNAQGESGYKGRVNNHSFATLKALGMIAVYSMIQTEVTKDINSTKNEYLQNAMTDVYTQASKIGNKIIDRALDIKPTITIKAGTEIKLITNTPLELPPMEIPQVTRKYVRTR